MDFKVQEFGFRGIKRIEIPKVDEDFKGGDFGESILKKYLPSILATHDINAKKVKYLYDYFLGMQDILAKERFYNKDKKNNHKEIENHAYRQVTFKKGFLTGEHREYTHKTGTKSDDLEVLDRYFTDTKFFSKDSALKEWIYATGIGATHTAPRTDIIRDGGKDAITGEQIVRFATREEGFDINYEAPYTYSTVDPSENFVVYSSRFDKQPLFCVSIVDVDVSSEEDNYPEIRKEILIETRYTSFKTTSDKEFSMFYNDNYVVAEPKLEVGKPKAFAYLPIIEYWTNQSRMGIVELNRSCFNLINTIKSSIADMTVDKSNVILVFKNTDIGQEEIEELSEAGAVILKDQQNGRNVVEADFDTVTIEIPFEGLNQFIETQLTASYDIAGVPLASGQVTSGGDTGQARLLGGGWNNAYIVINDDINSLLSSDYDQLALILLICKQYPNCPLNELYPSQIDIKYRINQNDNLLVKTQGIMNLYSVHMPLDEIVKVSGLFGDVTTVTKKWEDRIKEVNEQNTKTSEITPTEDPTSEPKADNRVVGADNGNNSQE